MNKCIIEKHKNFVKNKDKKSQIYSNATIYLHIILTLKFHNSDTKFNENFLAGN